MKTEVLEQVNQIFDALQKGLWSDHSPALLISSQGKLAVLQANVSSMVADARHLRDTANISVKQKEAERYLEHRKAGMTVKDSEINASVDVFEDRGIALDAERAYQDLKGVLGAMQSLTTAAQITIRELGRELSSTGYQRNA